MGTGWFLSSEELLAANGKETVLPVSDIYWITDIRDRKGGYIFRSTTSKSFIMITLITSTTPR